MHRNVNTHFNQMPTNVNIRRSSFNRDHSHKFSFNLGDLIPFYVDEVLPGDTFSIDTSKVIRIQPLVAPIMDEIFLDTYYFFVPNRLIWDNFTRFFGEHTEQDHSDPWSLAGSDLTVPSFYQKQDEEGRGIPFFVNSLYDYMGLPVNVKLSPEDKFNQLPIRAYYKIYNDWFRPENFLNPLYTWHSADGDLPTKTSIQDSGFGHYLGIPLKACKTFDYFTSCLPTPQKGPDVSIAYGGKLPVYFYEEYNPLTMTGSSASVYEAGHDYPKFVYKNNSGNFAYLGTHVRQLLTSNEGIKVHKTDEAADSYYDYPFTIANAGVELQNGFMNVSDLRTAFAVQKYYERAARGGTRYIESVKSFFGVSSPDARLQRSEYLGGNRIYLDIGQVLQTSATEDISPQGNAAGFSLTNNVNSDFTKSFTEHGFILGICVARYHKTYQQGAERMWFRRTLFDYYNPTFANISEQPVRRKEIYMSENHALNESVFGYNEAWADYRYKPNRVSGEMRSSHPTSLDIWHLGDYYNSPPYLGVDWLEEDRSILDRCLAVTSDVSNQLIADFYLKVNVARCMPLYSIPGLIDHN
ncbi:major capsid protein [Capybara microvirus Cap3_SP_632]|nr:major capsid protein [Capybara microvirus Cap3_SP_632]